MPYSNRNELSRLFGTFCHLWSKGLHAKVQMKTTESGGVLAQFEIELDKPHKPFPAGLPGFRRSQSHRAPRRHPGHESDSPNAPGHPGATGVSRRRPRRRGPKAIERSRLRAAAHQASLATARCSAPTTPTPMPPPAPPLPSFGPTSTRLIKVVPRRTSHRSSFSQVDGQVDGQLTVTAVRPWHMKMFPQPLPLPHCSRLPPKHHPPTGLGSNPRWVSLGSQRSTMKRRRRSKPLQWALLIAIIVL